MGLLDSVLGSVLSSAGSGPLGGLLGAVAKNPQLIQAVTGLLANDGDHGGLGGLMTKFKDAGLTDVITSWVGSGQNLPISADQITKVLGDKVVSGIASKLGIDPAEAAGHLATALPGLIDHLTPGGQAPGAGLGSNQDLMKVLGGLLSKA